MNRIRELRKERGMTLKQLGKKIGAAESTVSLYETGKRQPDPETLMRISTILGVSIDYLLGLDVPHDEGGEKGKSDRLYSMIRDMSEEEKDQVLQYAKFILRDKK